MGGGKIGEMKEWGNGAGKTEGGKYGGGNVWRNKRGKKLW